jgi:hypothetical protein
VITERPYKRKAWLDPATSKDELMSMLVPYDASQMLAYPIAARVGSPKHDDAEITQAADGVIRVRAESVALRTRTAVSGLRSDWRCFRFATAHSRLM